MRLLVGLGNPGPRHAGNRHNIGFMVVDAIARRHGFSPWRKRFHGQTAEGAIAGERVLLVKPETFMNESGRAVIEAVQFFKLGPRDVTVLHDELDLPPGKVRLKIGGGAAGHNGLRSIAAHLGPDFRRVRIGIGHPGVKEMVQHYVLQDFAKSERDLFATLCDIAADHADLLAKGQDATFQNRVHLAMVAKGFLEPDRPDNERKPAAPADQPD